eukprot:184576-Hanusia_phi.AAC.2
MTGADVGTAAKKREQDTSTAVIVDAVGGECLTSNAEHQGSQHPVKMNSGKLYSDERNLLQNALKGAEVLFFPLTDIADVGEVYNHEGSSDYALRLLPCFLPSDLPPGIQQQSQHRTLQTRGS